MLQRAVGLRSGGAMDGAGIKAEIEELAQALKDDLLIPDGHFSGFAVSNNGSDGANDIDVGAGVLRTAAGNVIRFVSTITKRLDAAYAAGTGSGGLATGSKTADTTYFLFACVDDVTTDSPVVDFYFDSDKDGANLPAGYDDKAYLWTIRTKGDNTIIPFRQRGQECVLLEPYEFLDDASLSNMVFETATYPGPPDSTAKLTVSSDPSTTVASFVWLGIAGITISITPASTPTIADRKTCWASDPTTTTERAQRGEVEVDANRQFTYASHEQTSTTQQIFMVLWSWVDRKRKVG